MKPLVDEPLNTEVSNINLFPKLKASSKLRMRIFERALSNSKVFEVQIHDEANVVFLYRKSLGEADYAQQANRQGLKTHFVQFPKMALSYARREENKYFACTLEMKDSCSSSTSTASTSSSASALLLRLDFKVKAAGADIPLLSLELKQATSDALINHLCSVYEDTKKGRDADVGRLRSELHQVREELSEAQSALHAAQTGIQAKDDELQSYREQNDELGQEVKKLEIEKEQLESANTELQNELDDVQQERLQLLEDNERLQQEWEDQQSYADKIDALCLGLKEEAKQARSKNDSLVRDNEGMQSAIKELDDKVRKYRTQLAAHVNCYREQQQLAHENVGLQDKVRELEEKYDRLQILYDLTIKSSANKTEDTTSTKASDSDVAQKKVISRANLLRK